LFQCSQGFHGSGGIRYTVLGASASMSIDHSGRAAAGTRRQCDAPGRTAAGTSSLAPAAQPVAGCPSPDARVAARLSRSLLGSRLG
jgi:hypothetical protein